MDEDALEYCEWVYVCIGDYDGWEEEGDRGTEAS